LQYYERRRLKESKGFVAQPALGRSEEKGKKGGRGRVVRTQEGHIKESLKPFTRVSTKKETGGGGGQGQIPQGEGPVKRRTEEVATGSTSLGK